LTSHTLTEVLVWNEGIIKKQEVYFNNHLEYNHFCTEDQTIWFCLASSVKFKNYRKIGFDAKMILKYIGEMVFIFQKSFIRFFPEQHG